MKGRILNITLFLLISPSMFSQVQEDRNIERLVSKLSEVYQKVQLLIDSMSVSDEEQTGLWSDLLTDKEISSSNISNERKSSVDISSGFPDFGLKWVSEVNSNFRQDISDAEDLFSRLRLSTGIDWVIWGEGSFTKRRQERRNLKKKVERDNFIREIHMENTTIKNKFYLMQDVFDNHRLILLNQCMLLLESQYNHEAGMHKQGLVDDVNLKKIRLDINAVASLIDLIKRYTKDAKYKEPFHQYWNLPDGYTDLPDFHLLEKKILSNSQERLFQLNQEVLKSQKKGGADFSVRMKFRYNYYEYKNHSGQTYPSLGVTVSLPLNFNRGNKPLEYELAEQIETFEQEQSNLLKELKDRHRHFYFLKNDLSDLKNDLEYIKVLLNAEKMKSKQSKKEFSPITYIDLSKKFIQKKIEILDKQQELCEDFFQFYLKAGFLNEKNTPQEPKAVELSLANKKNDPNLSTYLWGHFFNQKTNRELLEIFIRTKISTVFFSPANSDLEKTADFIKQCNSTGIKVYRLISENSYALSDDGNKKLQNKLGTIENQGFSGIHLNIEPHTFSDYKRNQETYTKRMNNLFIETKRWCDVHNMALSVSIPMHTPIEEVSVLKQAGIDAFIMAYENDDHSKLLDRTLNLRNVLGENTAWALRIKDFKSPHDIIRTKQLLHDHGIFNLAYYDCALLYRL